MSDKAKQLISLLKLPDDSVSVATLDKYLNSLTNKSVRDQELLKLQKGDPSTFAAVSKISDDLKIVENLLRAIIDTQVENSRVFFNHPELYDPLYRHDISDDFTSGSSETGEVGRLGWSFGGGGACVPITGTSKHPGLYQLSTTTILNNLTRFFIQFDAAIGAIAPYYFDDVNRMVWVVKPLSSTLLRYKAGLGNGVALNTFGTEAAYFGVDTGINTNWQCVCRAAGVSTVVDSGVAINVANFNKLEIYQLDDGNVDFFIDDDEVASITTNLPTGVALAPAVSAETLEVDSKGIVIDYFRIQLKRMQLAERFP